MKRWRRWLATLSLLLISSTLAVLTCTDHGLHQLAALPQLLSNGHLSIRTASGSLFGSLRLQGIRYADGIDTVLIEDLQITWHPAKLLNKIVLIQNAHATGIRIILGESSQETMLADFSLPLQLLIQKIKAEEITVLSGQEELWFIRHGIIDHLNFQSSTLAIDLLSLQSKEMHIQAKGRLQTANDYPLQLNLETTIQPKGYAPIAAQGTLTGPLNTLQLEAESQRPLQTKLSGRLTSLLGKTTWQARLDASDVTLPDIHQDWPDQRFPEVTIEGQGTLAAYTLRVRSLAGLPGLKNPPEISAELHGDSKGLQVQALHLAHGKTALTATGMLTWNPTLSWRAELRGTHIDPALFLEDWPGSFSCSLNTTGQFTDNQLNASLHLTELQGALRNYPLTGKGEFHLQNKQLHIPQFTLRSAGSILRISGKAADTIDLSGQIDSGNLSELWPNARGKLHAQVQLTGPATKPEIDIKLTGSRIGMGSAGIGKLTLETRGTLSRDGRFATSLNVEQLQGGGIKLNRARLHFQGSADNHTIIAEGQDTDLSSEFKIIGKYDDQVWQGSLQQTHITSSKFGNWLQRQETLLSISPEKSTMAPLCLAAPSSASVCLNGSWMPTSGTWQTHGTISSLPLHFLGEVSNIPWPAEGQINGTMDLAGKQSQILTGRLQSDTAGMVVHIPFKEGAEQRLQWLKNTLRADFADNQLQINLESTLLDKSSVRMDLRLANLQLPGTDVLRAPLKGTVQVNVQDLSLISLLTEQWVQLTGNLQGQFALNGSPAAPQIIGQMELANGQAEIPSLGITLSPLQIVLKGDNNSLRLLATAYSGTGLLRAESTMQLTPSDTNINTISITGEEFKAAHLPGIDLDVSPNLRLLLSKKQTEIRGTVTIPRAQVTSIDFNSATPPSTDMIVVDDPPSAPVEEIPFFSAVSLIAGDDVQINAYGLQGKITGTLKVIGQPHRPLVGNGTLTIRNGSFTLYGRRLKIDLGRLLFNNGPLTNPGVELRSENKKDTITSGVRIEGLLQHPEITFYSNPSMEQSAIISHLLQNTALGGETRQDTGLIGTTMKKTGMGGMVPYLQSLKKFSMIDEIKLETGTGFDSASLIFGSWLTHDFYVSYGKNLLKESGSFNTRYTLGKGFFFMTETGSSQSGGDIKYEFER